MDKRRTVEIIHRWIPADESHEGKWVREERLTRCRACRWAVKCGAEYWCQYYHHATRMTDYCSRAERRKTDETDRR